MTRTLQALFPALLLASTLAMPSKGQVPVKGPAPTPQAQGKSLTLHFGWPIPAKAHIVEKSLKKGRKAVTSYNFELVPDPENKGRWIGRMSDIQVQQMDTMGLTPEQLALSKKLLGAVTSALPTLSIDPKTLEAQAQGIRKGVEAVIQILRSTAKTDKDKQLIALVSKSMTSKAMLATLRASSLSFWKAWAETWNGLEVPPKGRSKILDGVISYPMGGEGKCKVKLTNLGSPKGNPELIQLRYEQTGTGDILGIFIALMKKSLPPAYRDRIHKEMFESASISVHMQATLHRKTLLPQRVLIEKTTEVKMKGRPARKQLERHDYHFTW
ncbi:MAG TPA: hypothetical protein ENK02_11365 [Planctomycetes bacterium]|nr:hypothetical protein [Planctomycetota bacterium]